MSTCSGLSALDHANTKFTKGYATSGIVCTTCRHEFILPEGAGPLQKGERYIFPFPSNPFGLLIRLGSQTLTTSQPSALPTILKQRRSYHTISCVSIGSAFSTASKISQSTTQNNSGARLSLASSPSFTWRLTNKIVRLTFPSITNPVLAEVIWRVLNGHGLVFREEVQRRIKDQDIGATQWMINSDIGTGPSSSVSVRPTFFSCTDLTPLIRCTSC